MYELWINANNNFLYYATNCTNIDDAYEEFIDKLNTIGVIADNFGYTELELRKWEDSNYEVIETKRR